VIGTFTFFKGDLLAHIFTKDMVVVLQGHEYLKAYAIDTLFTSFLFCYIGYFNGCGNTFFVMLQGIVGAFCVRVPLVFLISGMEDTTLFHIGLATPTSTVCQVLLCVSFFLYMNRKWKRDVVLSK
jgi:Na+-driven multidrug efflux pump